MSTKKVFCIVAVVFLLFAFAKTTLALNADYNRPNPTMDYVPQELGVYDTMYYEHAEHNCRKCHGNSTADRHHATPMVVRDGLCTPCHDPCTPGDPDCPDGIRIIRNCLTAGCHSWDDVRFGNKRWHHNTDMANSENCIACHNPNLIEEITPIRTFEMYPPTVVTPTPFSCENCHWSQSHSTTGDAYNPGHPSTYDHYDLWDLFVGFYEYCKPIYGNYDTHHMDFAGNVAVQCYKCHSQDPDNPNWNPYDPELIRYCEICHSIRTLHGIGPHVNPHAGWVPVGFHAGGGGDDPAKYRTGDNGTGTVPILDAHGNPTGKFWGQVPFAIRQQPQYSADEQCVGCHGDAVPPWDQEIPGNPAIDGMPEGMQPTAGSCGAIVTLRGSNFGAEHITGRQVVLAPKNMTCEWDSKVSVPIHAWTDKLIEWELPCWTFAKGNYCVRVETEINVSNRQVFTVEDHPTLLTTTPVRGPCMTWLTLQGNGGFQNKQSKMYTDNYHGVHHVVDFVASAGEYTATAYGTPSGTGGKWWTDTRIDVQLVNLFQDQVENKPLTAGGNFCSEPQGERNFVRDRGVDVPAGKCRIDIDPGVGIDYYGCPNEPIIPRCDCLALGTFSVYVKAIYFGDEDGTATDLIDNDGDGLVDEGDEGLTCGDTILQVEKSDPVFFELTNEPFLNKLNPRSVVYAAVAPYPLVKIYGLNFGPAQEDGVVRIGRYADAVNPALGLGKLLSVRNWSNDFIKVKVKVPVTWKGTKKYIWVEKAGKKSNALPLKILWP